MHLGGNWMARHSPRRFQNLAHAVTAAISQIDNEPLEFFQRTQCEDVRLGQVGNVNIVANTGPIRSRIVVAIDFHPRLSSQGHVENARNQMGLGSCASPRTAPGEAPATLK